MRRLKRHITRAICGQTGVSLLEVLIALFLTGIITTAVLKLYVTQHQSYIVQDDVATIQQNARASIDELTRQIRMAGYDLPAGLAALEASNTNPDTILIRYKPRDCETFLDTNMSSVTSDLKCGSDVSCFDDDSWVYIFHPDSGGGEFFQISAVQTGSRHIQHATMPLSRAYTEDAIIIPLEEIKVYIDRTTDADHPNLVVELPGSSPQIYADDITDLQFRYRLANGNVVDVPVLIDDVREVLIDITGRSKNPDWEMGDDSYRTRTYSSSVSLRNVGL